MELRWCLCIGAALYLEHSGTCKKPICKLGGGGEHF